MQPKENFISVVIPTYNRARIIKKAIDSVLNQTYQNFEVIIVDDNSTDNTEEVIASIQDNRIKYIKQIKNLGASAARNSGIKAAKGNWIAFLDADDIWFKNKLEKQVRVIPELTYDYAVIHCGLQYTDFSTGKLLNKRISKGNINEIVKYNMGIIPQTSTMIIKKKVLEDIGGFDESLPAHQESELGLRIAQKYKFKLIDEVLVTVYRNHDQITGNPSLYIKAKEIILKKHSDILSNELLYNYHNIIAGDSIINNKYTKAKMHYKNALKYKYFSKSILSYIALIISPRLTKIFFSRKYKRKGLIK